MHSTTRASTSLEFSNHSRYLLKLLLFTALYYLTARLGLLLPFSGEVSTLFWPSSALTLAVLLVFGLEYWPVPIMGALAVAISNEHSLPLTIGITIAHSSQLLIIAFILHRFREFDSTLNHLGDVLRLILLGMAGPALGALIAVITFQLSPEGEGKVMNDVLWHWWAGHSISILTLTPAAISNWTTPGYKWNFRRLVEATIAFTLLIVVGLLIFIRLPFGNIPLGHVVFPFLVWLAVRFGQREVTLGGFLIMFIAVVGTLHFTGPFSRPSLNLNLLLLVTFIDSVVVTALIINALISNWRAGQIALKQNNELLESRVLGRTLALSDANRHLQTEIDERQRIEYELLIAKDKAVEALEAKSQFLTHVSHDARTPINVISLYAEFMQTGRYGAITDKQEKALQTIRNNAYELEEFFENLLTQARNDNGDIMMTYQLLQLDKWLSELKAKLAPLAEKKGLRFEMEIMPDVPKIIKTDESAFKHILTNLLSNSIKFTERGFVKMAVYLEEDGNLKICVSDSGIGMSPAELEQIFEPFWQADSSTTRQAHRGIGLGMAIVKRNTKLLGGTIRVNSELNQGSEFTLALPVMIENKVTF